MRDRRAICLIVLPAYLVARTSWRLQNRPIGVVVAEQPAKIRITRSDGGKIEVRRPHIADDSVIGEMRLGIAYARKR